MWLPWWSCLLLRLRLSYSFSSTSCYYVEMCIGMPWSMPWVSSFCQVYRVTSSRCYFCGLYSTHSLNSLSQLVYNHSFSILHESVPLLKQNLSQTWRWRQLIQANKQQKKVIHWFMRKTGFFASPRPGYIAIASFASEPYQCVGNPDGTSSLAYHRNVLCWRTSEHSATRWILEKFSADQLMTLNPGESGDVVDVFYGTLCPGSSPGRLYIYIYIFGTGFWHFCWFLW